MRTSFALAALSALFTFSSAVVVQPADVGPLSPDKHPSTSLEESIRRMKLSLDRELVYLAHMEHLSTDTDTKGLVVRQQGEPAVIHGFTTAANDGTGVFRPILPGTNVPPARMVVEDVMESPTEDPEDGMDSETTTIPTFTTIETPIITPGVEPVPITPGAEPEPITPIPTQLPVLPTDDPVDPVESPPPRELTFAPAPLPVSSETPETTGEDTTTEGETPTPVEDGTEGAVTTDEETTDDGTGLTLPGIVGDTDSGLFPTDEEVSPSPEDGPVCFPSHATVQLEDGSVKNMVDVQIGDRVMVAPDTFSEVFMFTHKLSDVRHNFVRLQLSSGHELSLTRGHYLYVNGLLSAASTVNKGDTLTLADSSLAEVTRVSSVEATGLFNPQTVQGDIVVNGVLASTYTTAVQPKMAHALLAPLRAAYSRLGFCMTAFEAGADVLASYMPSGSIIN